MRIMCRRRSGVCPPLPDQPEVCDSRRRFKPLSRGKMQKGIKHYFASISKAVAAASTDTPPYSSQDSIEKDVDCNEADNLGALENEGAATVASLMADPAPSDGANAGDPPEATPEPEVAQEPQPGTPDSVETSSVVTSDSAQLLDEDESPICRKRSLMFDSGFVPDKLKCTDITEDFVEKHLNIIEDFINRNEGSAPSAGASQKPLSARSISVGSNASGCATSLVSPQNSDAVSSPVKRRGPAPGTLGALRARANQRLSADSEGDDTGYSGSHAQKKPYSTSASAASEYAGHDGDVEELTFVDKADDAKSSSTLTLGSEAFNHSSESEECVTDEERKMYLSCPASQKSRCFKAYVEHYYRYNETFVFPAWVRIREIRDRNGLKPTDEAYDPSTVWVPSRSHPWALAFRSCHFTECMQQWWYLKQDRFDQLLFFKMGKFYELFYHDACIVQEICGLRWMGSEAKPHVGFPERSLHVYASSCVARGFKVVVVEQTETPQQLEKRNRESGQRQNAVSRAICEIITPGTITRPEMLGTHSKQLLLISQACPLPDSSTDSLDCAKDTVVTVDTSTTTSEIPSESATNQPPGKPKHDNDQIYRRLGLRRSALPQFADSPADRLLCVCSMDASVGSVSLGMVDVSLGLGELRALIASVKPAEVVVDSDYIGKLDELYGMTVHLGFELTAFNCAHQFTSENVGNKDTKIAHVDHGQFLERARATLGPSSAAYERLLLLLQRYLSSVMLDNLLNYCTVGILDADHAQCMTLDGAALTQLELFKSQEGDESMCLFKFLNKTCCALGERMLRRWLLKPLRSVSRINARSAAVDFLRCNFSVCTAYQEQLSSMPDLERTFGKVLNAAAGCYKMAVYFDEDVFAKLYELHQLLQQFSRLQSHVASFFADANGLGEACPPLLQSMASGVSQVTSHCEELLSRLHLFSTKTCSSRNGVWAPSDEVRERIAAAKSRLDAVLVDMKRECPSAQFVHTKFRYEVELSERDYRRLSAGSKSLEVTSTRAGHVRVHNGRIVSLLQQLEEHEFALTQSELLFFQDAVRQLHERRHVFGSLLVTAAELDCLCSLASVAKSAVVPMVRAEVFERGSGEPYMLVRGSTHPMVCQLNPEAFVPNDLQLSCGGFNSLLLLTGPNMGGKSTLLRQTALCAVMAQMGSFVSATECKMTVVDRVFTRLGSSDNLVQGKSTFLVELEEVSSILHTVGRTFPAATLPQATRDSLVLVDELGRGTSTFDATAIAAACLEKISAIGSRCMFTTHFQEVCAYSLQLPNVSPCHMTASFDDEARTLTFLYKLALGPCPESHGIHVARLAGIPAHVLEMAERVSQRFRAQKRSPVALVSALLGAHSRGDEALLRALYEELC
ncbi:DNA repair protein [Babesia caballi]|uniref:DNA repair protein n=1 Tax=Babesia caballi TaxID=5871 RepID=A0AAV4LZV4_BABCB|nr:DNA repair protein [Babesia caballi]